MNTDDFRSKLYEVLRAIGCGSKSDQQLYVYSDWLMEKENRKNLPDLYRYSKADYYNISALETGTLFLSPIGTMNDAFEGLGYEINEENIRAEKRLKDSAFVKSFSEKYDSLRMWGIYADSYRGMCVKYNIKGLDEDCLRHLFPVCYSAERLLFKTNILELADAHYLAKMIPFFEEKVLDSNIQWNDFFDNINFEALRDIMPLYLIKSKEWEYECEWRLLSTYLHIFVDSDYYSDDIRNSKEIANEQAMSRLHSKKENGDITTSGQVIPFDCATEVLLGPRMDDNIKSHIIQICKKKNIIYSEMKLSEREYSIEKK